MDKNAVKKTAVIVIAVLFILCLVTIPALYFIAEAPLLLVVVIAAVYLCLAVATLYYACERLKEIDEGLDDAVNDY